MQPNDERDGFPSIETRGIAEMIGASEDMARPVAACVLGDMPAHLALMQLCMTATNAGEVENAILAAGQLWGEDIPSLVALRELWRSKPGSFELVRRMLGAVDHRGGGVATEAELAACARAFDEAAAISPEGSVALYTLGDAALLAEATGEVATRMRGWGLLGRDRAALEIGCGNGRFLAALSPELRHITGIDISAAMVEGALRRCAGLANVDVRQTDGRGLAEFADASFDLVLAADSFPYIVRLGDELTERHFAEAGRVLKPGGRFLILNFSYSGNPAGERAEVARRAGAHGLSVLRVATRDFRLWDGATFLLGKEGE